MCAYAAENLRKKWFTGEEHTKMKLKYLPVRKLFWIRWNRTDMRPMSWAAVSGIPFWDAVRMTGILPHLHLRSR